jgi:hypothetical protein
MVAAAKHSELIEIIDHMLAEVRERVLSTPFRVCTAPEIWRAAETSAESAKGNADAALAMLRMRGPAYFPLADAARDVLITLAWMVWPQIRKKRSLAAVFCEQASQSRIR